MKQSANPSSLIGLTGLILLALLVINMLTTPACAQYTLEWHPFEKALAIADSTQRPIFVDVWAPWCGWCRKMKREVYPELRPYLKGRFVLTRLNRDDNESSYDYMGSRRSPKSIAQELKAQSVPAIVFLNPEGEYLSHVSGFIDAKKLKPILQ